MNKMGLKTGHPLIGAASDNEKGFFERIDVVLQNDALMGVQNVHYAVHTSSYNALQGLKAVLNTEGDSTFIVYHAYTRAANGASLLNIKPLFMDNNEWPILVNTGKLFRRNE